MFYEFAITVPPNIPESAAIRQEVTLTVGAVRKVEVQFPSGCAGLVHARIWRQGVQVWPSNPGGEFASDGYIISFDEKYLLEDEPLGFTLEVWNEDITYEHQVRIRFLLDTLEMFWSERAFPGQFPARRAGERV